MLWRACDMKSSLDNTTNYSGTACRSFHSSNIAYRCRITWYPVVLSFSFASKELKSNPLQSFCEKVEALDIKVHLDYIRESTTHVVSKKRNTSKGLQALINGRYIVDYTFIDAVEAAAEATEEQVSLLESDFNSNWPNELQFLPPRGAEPTQRSSDAYSPDPRRQDIFEGYTFIFFDQAQFDNLLAPVTDGRGKALLRHVDPFKTDVEDFVRYVKDVAGEKGLGEFEDGSEGKGVVVVRYQPAKGPTLDWYANFGRQVALHLDHRLIEQREFLDAILSNDASVLRKPLEVEESGIVAPPPTAGKCMTAEIMGTETNYTSNHNRPQSTSINSADVNHGRRRDSR
jgi:nijmegen breakage syndrome protein 1